MEEKVLIIKTTQKIDGQIEKKEIEVSGKWYKKNTKKYLLYKEGNFTDVKIKVEKDKIMIKKTGQIIIDLTLEIDKRQKGKLETPYGSFIVETETTKITSMEDTLYIDYKLFDENDNVILDNSIEIITK